eukprot:6197331-Pleurochrysis_carterae.AAC.1
MAARDFDKEVASDRANLSAHREARSRKEELACEAGVDKLQESYINSLRQHRPTKRYQEPVSEARCAERASAHPRAGLRLERPRHRLVEGEYELSPADVLLAHLKQIIAQRRVRVVPDKPPVPLLQRTQEPASKADGGGCWARAQASRE